MSSPSLVPSSLLFSVVLVMATSSCGEAPAVEAVRRDPPPGMEMVLPAAELADAGAQVDVADAGQQLSTTTNMDGARRDAGVVSGGQRTEVDAGVMSGGPPVDAGVPARDGGLGPPPGLWVSGYYPGWTRTSLAAADIDYAALTHVIDFSLHPRTDGTLEDTHTILPGAATTVAAAHAAGVKVLVCVGGANTVAGFQSATSPARLTAFVDNLMSVVTRYGYDGIDIDWEPLTTADRPQYVALVDALHARLGARTPRGQLTAAVDSWSASTVSLVADRLDQINLMTYDMADTGSDWVSWFNSPLSNGGQLRPSGSQLPAADVSVQSYANSGLAASKLGIGIAFYGNLWSGGAGTDTGGVTAPGQRWTTAPTMTAIDYRTIKSTWYQPGRYHHDAASGSAWLSVDQPGSVDDRFLTYDDEATIALKLAWAKSHGLGGVILFQLGGGYLPTAAPGQRDPLLQAVKAHR